VSELRSPGEAIKIIFGILGALIIGIIVLGFLLRQ
jgi:hypothetical protein